MAECEEYIHELEDKLYNLYRSNNDLGDEFDTFVNSLEYHKAFYQMMVFDRNKSIE